MEAIDAGISGFGDIFGGGTAARYFENLYKFEYKPPMGTGGQNE